MKIYRLHYSIKLPISLRVGWDFFSDPWNLAKITPPSMAFRIVNKVPRRVYAGMIIIYKVKPLLGIPVKWVTEITHMDEPGFFVDEQRFGPYRFWHHQHILTEVQGGIEAEDIVHYALPVPLLGGLINSFAVKRQLRKIFEFREKALKDIFGG